MNFQDVWQEVWRSAVIILAGMLLLRFSGRKSVSQMTVPTTIIMVSIGTVLVQPIAKKSIWLALIAATTFVLILHVVEFLQVKWDWMERTLKGKSKTVIYQGQVQMKELNKLRVSLDQLEMALRLKGISRIQDVKTATIEPNGQLGYELFDKNRPITLAQMEELLTTLFPKNESLSKQDLFEKKNRQEKSIFNEVTEPVVQDMPENSG